MTHPLVQRLFDDFGYPQVTLEGHRDFVSQPGLAVLFFAGDPNRFRDTTDIAVVLPELVKALGGGLRAAVVAPEAGKPLQQEYGFELWPALVFLRDGAYLGSISGIQNWSDYLRKIDELLATGERPRAARVIPTVTI
jgi:hydrogenase-1 operon protein HyaE